VGTFPTVTGERQPLRRSQDEQTADTTDRQSCPECSGSLVADSDNGETVCGECGLVVEEDTIDRGPEWRAFEASEKDEKSRVGAPTTKMLHDDGLTTTISWQDKDAYGSTLGDEKRVRVERLRTWQTRIRTKNPGERNLQYALGELNRMASAVGVPDSVQEIGAVMYRRALDEDLIRGRSIESVATGCLYAACRQEGFPRSLDELTAVSRVDKKEVGRTYRYLAQELGVELEPTDPKQYVPRFCSKLGVSEEIEMKATEILDAAAEQNIFSGRSPPGLAGAAIYAATILCNDKRPQHEVADAADVTVVTIRNRYQEQMEAMENRRTCCCRA
jgi:transcription initiation factor TFIIB